MKLLSLLKTIGTDIEKGLAFAVPVIGEFQPELVPMLAGIDAILKLYEKGGVTLSQDQAGAVVSAVATHQAIVQHANALGIATAALEGAAAGLTGSVPGLPTPAPNPTPAAAADPATS